MAKWPHLTGAKENGWRTRWREREAVCNYSNRQKCIHSFIPSVNIYWLLPVYQASIGRRAAHMEGTIDKGCVFSDRNSRSCRIETKNSTVCDDNLMWFLRIQRRCQIR